MEPQNIQDVISAVVRRAPGGTAFEDGDRLVTYGELERDSDRIARTLEGTALPGSRLGIYADRTVAITTAILGALKAGCAFVPLDPTLPGERLRWMLERARPAWLAMEGRHAAALSELLGDADGVQALALDGADDAVADAGFRPMPLDTSDRGGPPAGPFDPEGLASVYFTSGSTGRPKAIAGRLRGIAGFTRWQVEALGLGAATRGSQLVSPAFDGFLRDVFTPLSAGGAVCVPESSAVLLDAERLVQWIDGREITLLQCVPSLFRAILSAEPEPERFASLRDVVLFGEALFGRDVRAWRERFGDRVRLVNLYGPTETTLTKLFHIARPEDADRRTVPVGRPIEGAQVAILDRRGAPVPPGVIGEIYLRTPDRALGYLDDPEITQAAFVPNPLGDDPDDVVYRTGDFGRVLEDGCIEFVGREDQQVKVRGVRVELTEIESHLVDVPGVEEAAVVKGEDVQGHPTLLAYVVARQELSMESVRAFLAGRVPEAMVPSSFIRMKNLPRTPNGKVDRRGLPRVAPSAEGAGGGSPPRGPVEEMLAILWSDLLGYERVAREDEFFRVGGHSLLVTQLLARIRRHFGIELSIPVLFAHPTLAGMARQIEALCSGDAGALPPVERSAGDRTVFPLSFAQERLWRRHLRREGDPTEVLTVALESSEPLDRPVLERAWASLIERHESLRTRFEETDGEVVQVVEPEAPGELTVSEVRGEAGMDDELRRVVGDLGASLDPRRGGLLRAHLIRLGRGGDVLVLAVHHLIVDEWSLQLVYRELIALYRAHAAGESAELPVLGVHYGDFARWQRRAVEEGALEGQAAYWARRLAGAPAPTRVPPDEPPAAGRPHQCDRRIRVIPEELLQSVRRLASRQGATPFMAVLTAFQVLLRHRTGERDLLFGLAIANRRQVELEGVVGRFANDLPFRCAVSDQTPFADLLERTRGAVLDDFAHQDLPVEVIAQQLDGVDAVWKRLPFHVFFNYQMWSDAASGEAGPPIRPRSTGARGTLFDLSFRALDTGRDLRVRCDYACRLYDGGTVGAVLEDLERVLRAAVEKPERNVCEILDDLCAPTSDARRRAG